jgi:hypothetical protein
VVIGRGKGREARRAKCDFPKRELPRSLLMLKMMATICKHPKVRIVSRHDDSEYVECLECGEIFDSDEFRDMEIEETAKTEGLADDS